MRNGLRLFLALSTFVLQATILSGASGTVSGTITDAVTGKPLPGAKSQYNPVLPLFPVRDGYITAPESPGLGIEPSPADIEKYRVD